jgi:hypothetical protein
MIKVLFLSLIFLGNTALACMTPVTQANLFYVNMPGQQVIEAQVGDQLMVNSHATVILTEQFVELWTDSLPEDQHLIRVVKPGSGSIVLTHGNGTKTTQAVKVTERPRTRCH